MKSLITLTIAISALNEERNIGALIKSLLSQKEVGYRLHEIIIASDGSTDQTVQVVKEIDSDLVKIRNYSNKQGKSFRLAQIYNSLNSDFVLQLDADLQLTGSDFIIKLLKPFKDNAVGMTGANAIPKRPATFVGKAIASSVRPYTSLKDYYPSLSVGPAMALRTDLAKQMRIPKGLIGEDIFAYFKCLTLGYKYVYVKEAVVNYVLPQNIKEHIAQNVRFLISPKTMENYFDISLLKKEDHIPFLVKIKALLSEAFTHPIEAIAIFFINLVCRFIAIFNRGTHYKNWHPAQTTKVNPI